MNYHKTVDDIKKILELNHIKYDYLEHAPVRTSEEAAKIRPEKYSIEQGAKAIIVRIKITSSQKKFCMLVVPGSKRFDEIKVKNLLKAKDIRFANEEEVRTITSGIEPGGIPPFGNIFNLEVFVDKSLFEMDRIIFNAGDKRVSVSITTKDYIELVKPNIAEIT